MKQTITDILRLDYHTTPENATAEQLTHAVAKAARSVADIPVAPANTGKRASYLSAEFLIGRILESNLLNLGLLDTVRDYGKEHHIDADIFSRVADPALGNGGLGRLAACFLESAATKSIPLDGYGIRYRYGLFRQCIDDGFQRELPDDWLRFGDPWSTRSEQDAVTIDFGDVSVRAIPYDMPVIGYRGGVTNRLRLWQCEAVTPFDFSEMNTHGYDRAVAGRTFAEAISSVLYPNDETPDGKKLRLRQQYFFSAASVQDMLRTFRRTVGDDYTKFPDHYAIQLNDTHPVVAILEFLRLLRHENVPFAAALDLCRRTFSYTNHTILPEALETWEISLFESVLPALLPILRDANAALLQELDEKGIPHDHIRIIDGDRIHMARLAVWLSHQVNGVAAAHTEILKSDTLRPWHALYPDRIVNRTNGITPRRWLRLANEPLSTLITDALGTEDWVTDLPRLRELTRFSDDPAFLDRLTAVKAENKRRLAAYLSAREGINIDPDFLFDVQIKRLHEYKRQLLNAFSVVDTCFGLKEGRICNFHPTLYLFGAKAAPGYRRAKGIIKYLHEIAAWIDRDPELRQRVKLVFVPDYNVSRAAVIIPAAELSQQISAAGTEASGTGNMKLMANGALTCGTLDGANIEIVREAGEENNFIFGLRVEEAARIRDTYDPSAYIARDPRLARVLATLTDGTFDDGGTGLFRELHDAIVTGASWHRPDPYFLCADFASYCDTRLTANITYRNRTLWAKKSLANIAACGYFSSDRTVAEYGEIWGVSERQ